MEAKLKDIVDGITWLTGSYLEQREVELEEQGRTASSTVGAVLHHLDGSYRQFIGD